MINSRILQQLTQYGANMNEAMERFMDDEELYIDCLMMFMQDPSFDRLTGALAAKDYRAAFEAAHTLKGVAGNLGLTPVYTDICDIVEQLRANQYDHLTATHNKIQEQMAILQELVAQNQE